MSYWWDRLLCLFGRHKPYSTGKMCRICGKVLL